MYTSVVGSFPFEIKSPEHAKDKFLNIIGKYDPYKLAIKDIVISQLNAGIDIVSDGQVRDDMVATFTKNIPGFIYEQNSSVIVSKIKPAPYEITTNDIKFAKNVLNNHINENDDKGIKGIITGPSTLVYSSRIESFYKNKDDAIIDLAKSLRLEIEAIDKLGVKYIQIDEPFLSTGMVNLATASKAIKILSSGIKTPIAIHVCGNLTEIFEKLINFKVDIIDCEFAGNDYNLKLLEDNGKNLKNKTIGFGCLDTTLNKVDDYDKVKSLVKKAIDVVGPDNLILDPDCGLRKMDKDIAIKKLELLSNIKKEFN
ncbi:methionine synthase [Methanobrevibacter sp. DSM 116169]|uniref:methionine synthase n=1 Tax=Methanobrevibacter sp. DSM 116169 TaxID=3242727 RepID=UPI0038FCCCE6